MGHSGGGHHGSGFSHSYSYSSTGYTGDHYYESSGSDESSCSKGKFLLIIGVVIVLFVTMCSFMGIAIHNSVKNSDMLGSPELSPGEQYLWCGDKKIQLRYKSTDIKVYQSLYGTPEMSEDTRNISASMSGHLYKSYKYHSFFLPPGSYLYGQKSTTAATFIVIKGEKQMLNFVNDDQYEWIYRNPNNTFELNSTLFDEYFVVVDSTSSTSFTAEINATITLYDTSNLTEQCTSNLSKCDLNEDNDPNFCIVIDFDAEDFYHSVEVKISGDDIGFKSDTIFAVSICSILFIWAIILTTFVIRREMRKSSEQNAGSSTGDDPSIEFKEEEVNTETTQPKKEEETYSNTSSYPVSSPSDIPTAIITGLTETNNSYPSMYSPNDSNQYPTEPPPPYTTY